MRQELGAVGPYPNRSLVLAQISGQLVLAPYYREGVTFIVLAVAMWGYLWTGMTVLCKCDNMAVVAIINSGRSRMDKAMHLMRCLSFFPGTVGCGTGMQTYSWHK